MPQLCFILRNLPISQSTALTCMKSLIFPDFYIEKTKTNLVRAVKVMREVDGNLYYFLKWPKLVLAVIVIIGLHIRVKIYAKGNVQCHLSSMETDKIGFCQISPLFS